MADTVTHLSANCIKAKLEGDSVNGSQMVMQLMEHKLFEEGANAKKGLKSRATLSDGVSYVSCLITDKTFSKIARDEWEKAVKHSVISVLGSGLQQQTVGGKTILILKEPFQVLYTGLRRTIGSPKDHAKNRDDGTFPTNFDLAIPLNETTERGRNVEARVDEFFDNSNVRQSMERNVGINQQYGAGAANLARQRVAAPLSSVGKTRPSLGGSDAGFTPINVLNTYTQEWVIKAKITKKYSMRTWNNAKGSGTLLNMDVVDRSQTQIQCTFFNDAAIKFNETVEEGKVYTMAGGQVKLANKRFTTIPNDFCITFDSYAKIEEVQEAPDATIQGGGFNFTTLRQVAAAEQVHMIDLIAVVTDVQPMGQIQMKTTGEYKDKRTITLCDDTGVSINATLWGGAASQELQVGDILACKAARVSDYGGKSLNLGEDNIVNPAGEPRSEALMAWYKDRTSNGQALETEKLTQTGDGGVNAALPIVLVEEMAAHLLSDEQFLAGDSPPRYFKISGQIFKLMADRDLWYTACPERECKKKVTPADSGLGYFCDKCQKTYPDCKPIYNFSILVGDLTTKYMQVLGDTGEGILGMPAADLKAIRDRCGDGGQTQINYNEPLNEFRQLVKSLEFKPAQFLVRAKVDTYTLGTADSENKVRYTIVRQLPHQVADANRLLLERLAVYALKPCK